MNAALSHLRSLHPGRTLDDDVGDLPPGVVDGAPPEALSRIGNEELLRLMNELPEGFRTVLMLHAVEGYRHAEIAEMLEISEATSRTQYMRARARLAQLIEEEEHFY